nr:hypothetical protein [Tanacetum cinerariifolium]
MWRLSSGSRRKIIPVAENKEAPKIFIVMVVLHVGWWHGDGVNGDDEWRLFRVLADLWCSLVRCGDEVGEMAIGVAAAATAVDG